MAVKRASPTSLLSEFAIECSGKNDPDEMVEWFLERCIELLQAERGFLISFESPTSFSFTAAKNYEGEQIKKPATQARTPAASQSTAPRSPSRFPRTASQAPRGAIARERPSTAWARKLTRFTKL